MHLGFWEWVSPGKHAVGELWQEPVMAKKSGRVRRGHAVKTVNKKEEFGLNFNAFESDHVHFRV